MQVRPARVFTPSSLATLAVCMSAVAWLVPTFGFLTKGYIVASPWTAMSVIALVDWYALMYLALRLGEFAGAALHRRLASRLTVPALDDPTVFLAFTVLAAVGILSTYLKIFSSMSLVEAVFFISSGMGNELKESLYSEYSAGVVSLRYLVLYSASLAIYRIYKHRKYGPLVFTNIALLVMSALLSSRLIFVATVLSSLFLCLSDRESVRLRFGRVAIFVFLLFFVLSALNYSRNSNYYASDNLFFWGAGASSILTYLGSPFQVAVGAAEHITRLAEEGAEMYRDYVDIDITLNSNSAFVQMHEAFGFWAWLYLTTVLFSAATLFSYFRRYGRTALLLPCCAILYACSELWRLDLFRQGIFIVWLGMGCIVPITIGLARRITEARAAR